MIAKTLRTNLVIQGMTFVTSIMLARVLGPTGRGELALVLLYPQLVTTMALLGIDRAVAVMVGRGELAQPVRTIVKLVLLLALPTMAAAWIAVSWCVSDAHLAYLAKLYVLYAAPTHFFVLVVAMFNGVGEFSRFNRARLGFYVFNTILLAAIWVSSPQYLSILEWVLLANFVSVFGGWLYCIWLLRSFEPAALRKSKIAAPRGLWGVISLAIVFAFPLALAQFNGVAYQIVIENWIGVNALGIFVVLITYSRLLSPIGGAVGSHVFRLGIAGDQCDISRIFRFSFIVYFCFIVLLWALAPLLIPLIFGSAFAFDADVVGALLVSTLFSMLSDSLAEYLNGCKKGSADFFGRLLYIATLGLMVWSLAPGLDLLSIATVMAVGDLARCVWLVQRVASATGFNANRFIQIQRGDMTDLLQASRNFLKTIFA